MNIAPNAPLPQQVTHEVRVENRRLQAENSRLRSMIATTEKNNKTLDNAIATVAAAAKTAIAMVEGHLGTIGEIAQKIEARATKAGKAPTDVDDSKVNVDRRKQRDSMRQQRVQLTRLMKDCEVCVESIKAALSDHLAKVN